MSTKRFFLLTFICIQILYCVHQCFADDQPLIRSIPPLANDDLKMASLFSAKAKSVRPMKKKPLNFKKVWEPPRIGYFSGDSYTGDRRCPKENTDTQKTITTIKDETVNCSARSVVGQYNEVTFTDWYRTLLTESAKYVDARLSAAILLKRLDTDKVSFEKSTDPICKHFKMDYGSGLQDKFHHDIIFFYAAHQMSEADKDQYAYAQFCPSDKNDPLIIVVNRNPDKLSEEMHEPITNTIRKVFDLDWCPNGKMMIERNDNGTDISANKCLQYDCNAENGKKFVDYKTKEQKEWTRCTDRKGMPLQNLNPQMTCPSWYEICSPTMEEDITQTLTFTETKTISVTPIPPPPTVIIPEKGAQTDKSTISENENVKSTKTVSKEVEKAAEKINNNSVTLPLNSTDYIINEKVDKQKQKDNSYGFVYFYCNSLLLWMLISMMI